MWLKQKKRLINIFPFILVGSKLLKISLMIYDTILWDITIYLFLWNFTIYFLKLCIFKLYYLFLVKEKFYLAYMFVGSLTVFFDHLGRNVMYNYYKEFANWNLWKNQQIRKKTMRNHKSVLGVSFKPSAHESFQLQLEEVMCRWNFWGFTNQLGKFLLLFF